MYTDQNGIEQDRGQGLHDSQSRDIVNYGHQCRGNTEQDYYTGGSKQQFTRPTLRHVN
jgi:hypothetical protein